MRTTPTFLTVAALLFSSCAMASDSETLDISLEFSGIDTNQDLYIDKEEFDAFLAKMREAAKARFGGDRGGRFQGGGPGERMGQIYADADADGDGLLNEYEFNVLQASMAERRKRWKEKGRL